MNDFHLKISRFTVFYNGCLLIYSIVVTMDTKSTDTNSNQPISSSGVGELL